MPPSGERMSAIELRAGVSLAGIFGLRMLGLFLILPVFAVHAPKLAGGDNLTLVGLALGAYGLAQAVLQIPYGMASDRWGRKPLIILGLIVFAAGSFLAAAATDIWLTIAGRALQGAGAISSVVVALAADLTREQHRTKIMAMIGATIGFSFAVSLVAAPALYRVIGMSGLFVLTGVLSLAAIWVVRAMVPASTLPERPRGAPGRAVLRESLLNPDLLRLNGGIFVLHLIQMAMFVVVPTRLVSAGLALPEHWKLYLPVVLASFVLMVPAIFYADRRNQPKPVMVGAVWLLVAVEAGLAAAGTSVLALGLLLLAFFLAFNVLEAMIPSLVSRYAPAAARGTALGVYNTTQTLGLFFGGLIGGVVADLYGSDAVFSLCAVLAALWLLGVTGMRSPAVRAVNENADLTFSIGSGVDLDRLGAALRQVRGVREVQLLANERVAHLRVVPGDWDEGSVRKLVTEGV